MTLIKFSLVILIALSICNCDVPKLQLEISTLRAVNKKIFQPTTTITSTTSTTTTTMRPIPTDCPISWKRFDIENDPLGPSRDGVLIGFNLDGSPAYIGRGSVPCSSLSPARVVINGTQSPGLYVLCGSSETQVPSNSTNFDYLVNGRDNYFSWVKGGSDNHFDNSINLKGSSNTFVLSRYNGTSSKMQKYSTVSLTFMDIGTYFFDPEVKLIYSIGKGNSEILVCSTTEDGSAVRSKEDPQTACVYQWKQISIKVSTANPANNGVLIGKYVDGSDIYVGKGYNVCYGYAPGRAPVGGSGTSSVYSTCINKEDGQTGMLAQFLVRNDSQIYEWKSMFPWEDPSAQVNVHYLNTTMCVCRKNLTTNENSEFSQIAIGFPTNISKYFNPVTKISYLHRQQPIDVLTCRLK